MFFEILGPAILFGLAATMTPGPNNVLLLASGANFGFRRTIPHMIGIVAGVTVLDAAIGLGLGGLITAYPAVHLALKLAGGAYLLYLAFKIARTRRMDRGDERARPMTLAQAAAFQWVNPKAWVAAITGLSLFLDPRAPLASLALVLFVWAVVTGLSVMVWAGFGSALRDFLSEPRRLKWFNLAMGGLLAISVVPMVA